MIKDDVIKAQKLVSNTSSNLVSNTPYHDSSFIYRTTNEKINEYQSFLKNKKNILSIIASGNQILNTIYEGNKNITGFDISTFPKYYLELQIGALITFQLEDYLKFIYTDITDEEFDDMYDMVHSKLDSESKIFWDGLLNYFDFSEITSSTLFSNETTNLKTIIERNKYLQGEEEYQRLKSNIEQANLKYVTGNIFDLAKELDSTYDFINLSSIIYYNSLDKYKELLENLPLTDNGNALTYLYKVKQLQNNFSNCTFHQFNDNQSGVMIYTKKKNK